MSRFGTNSLSNKNQSKPEDIYWGPIPSRSLLHLALKFKVLDRVPQVSKFSRLKSKRRLKFKSELIQFLGALLLSWIILNLLNQSLFLSRSSYPWIDNSDWAIQGWDPVLLALLLNLIVILCFSRFIITARNLKKTRLKYGKGLFWLVPYVLVSLFLLVLRDADVPGGLYPGYVETRLRFNISLAFLTAFLFLGLDSRRTIKIKSGIE